MIKVRTKYFGDEFHVWAVWPTRRVFVLGLYTV